MKHAIYFFVGFSVFVLSGCGRASTPEQLDSHVAVPLEDGASSEANGLPVGYLGDTESITLLTDRRIIVPVIGTSEKQITEDEARWIFGGIEGTILREYVMQLQTRDAPGCANGEKKPVGNTDWYVLSLEEGAAGSIYTTTQYTQESAPGEWCVQFDCVRRIQNVVSEEEMLTSYPDELIVSQCEAFLRGVRIESKA